jgi:hypothetical protein
MATELVNRLAILVAIRRFFGMGAADSRFLRSRNISFVELLPFLFDVLWGICGEISCNVFLLLFMVLWVLISATLCMRAVLMLWHAFMFLGLRFPPLLFFLLDGLCCFLL